MPTATLSGLRRAQPAVGTIMLPQACAWGDSMAPLSLASLALLLEGFGRSQLCLGRLQHGVGQTERAQVRQHQHKGKRGRDGLRPHTLPQIFPALSTPPTIELFGFGGGSAGSLYAVKGVLSTCGDCGPSLFLIVAPG